VGSVRWIAFIGDAVTTRSSPSGTASDVQPTPFFLRQVNKD
jgi:hypothetical protein